MRGIEDQCGQDKDNENKPEQPRTAPGAIVRKDGGGMKDLKNRLSKAKGAFIRLKKTWRPSNITRKTKLRLRVGD